ncbi:hypothetical protein M501DRAFT_1005628 [Patellaria atrata CBS 101060]|uniref:Uncharacterized protein n=1 Tax=Patellaria atrata CBS 101060 TaxID=1346257 RepID=A0A9P4VTB0_9PEZI|nr:hypothetical protein M501DRAFT_1005628 [Patellaria atrata CBS 101060]
MRYVRFLKQPKLEGQSIKSVITVTSDLGDSFLAEDLLLSASVRSNDTHGKVMLRQTVKWSAGMRACPVSFDISKSKMNWPARVHVGLKNFVDADLFENQQDDNYLPSIVSVWSSILDPLQGIKQAERKVERRFRPMNHRTLSIWEETGESIARHIWDGGVALVAYIDRIAASRADDLPIFARVLSSSSYKRVNVLELGSGVGMVGISLAQTISDCDVLLTDLPEAEEITLQNLSVMKPAMKSKVAFQAVDWEMPLPENIMSRLIDLILVSECTYNTDTIPALVRTISTLVKRSPKATVALATKVRHPTEAIFLDLMAEEDLVISAKTSLPLPREDSFAAEQVDMYIFHGRDELIMSEFV